MCSSVDEDSSMAVLPGFRPAFDVYMIESTMQEVNSDVQYKVFPEIYLADSS